MKILVTGISGSGGSYLAEYLLSLPQKHEVIGLTRWHSSTHQNNLKSIRDKVKLLECDLMDLSSVIRSLDLCKPDAIVHLAAHANVRASFDTPLAVIDNNITSTANLFEAVRCLKMSPKILMCSTSEVYGQVDPKNVPIDENCPLRPVSPYAVSKLTQDMLAFSYHTCFQLPIIRTRMFTYINPRRSDLFATSFAMQVAKIEAGQQSVLKHGNLDSVRTLLDVRDAVSAYWLSLEKGVAGEVYNIGGTETKTVGEFLDVLKSKAKVPIKSEVDPSLMRAGDVTLQVPNSTKFVNATGWRPQYSFNQSVDFLLDECRRQIAVQT